MEKQSEKNVLEFGSLKLRSDVKKITLDDSGSRSRRSVKVTVSNTSSLSSRCGVRGTVSGDRKDKSEDN